MILSASHSLELAAIAAALFAAACGDPPSTSCQASGIVNGQVALGSPAVVALTEGTRQFCTGTLIAPRVVVTAAHCLPPNLPFEADPIVIAFGTEFTLPDAAIEVVEFMAHPGWSVDTVPDDIGIVRLASDAPVAPIPLFRMPITQSLVGANLHVLGFGTTAIDEADNGLKREGTTSIMEIDESSIHLAANPSLTCFGDSGGPALIDVGGTELLIGIHSRSDCASVFLDERVDRHLESFIDPFIGPAATCAMDGLCASGCAAPDLDCPCADDDFCTLACAIPDMDPDCPQGCGDDGTCVEDCPIDPDCACP